MDAGYRVHLFLLLDASGAAAGGPLETLNRTVPEIAEIVGRAAAEGLVRDCFHVLAYGGGAPRWLCGTDGERGISGAALLRNWRDLREAGGGADLAGALRAVLSALTVKNLGHNSFPPVLVLLGTGADACPEATAAALEELGDRGGNTRIAVALGEGGNTRIAGGPGGDEPLPAALEAFASVSPVAELDSLGFPLEAPRARRLCIPAGEAADFFINFMRGCRITS